MSGEQLKSARKRLGLTQQEAARKWRVSQGYVALLEGGKRRVPDRLAHDVVRREPRLATALPLRDSVAAVDQLPEVLGALGYAQFSHLANHRKLANPAAVLLQALRAPAVPSRVTEALPWLLVTFADMDWTWLVEGAKASNTQNRLGFLVSLARQLAEKQGLGAGGSALEDVEKRLEEARLVKEDTLGRDLTEAERHHFRAHRPALAAHWNLLTSLQLNQLRYAS